MRDAKHALRDYRAKHDLTLEQLAADVGTTRSWLSRIESGEEQASMALVARLKARTGLSADNFIVPSREVA